MADAEPWKTVKIPPIVQELVTGVQEPPSRYVIAEHNRPAVVGSEMPDLIPIVDLSWLSDNCANEVAKLRSALENSGLFLNLAKLLDLHEGHFVNMFDENALTYARLNYYPNCPKPDHVFGMKPHTDASVITIVFVDDNVSGLQLQKDGVWYNVPIVPNALLVNMGDVMEIMSNGFFKSPIHRVVTNAEKERLSLVMFYTLNPEKEIEPLPELVDEKRPRRYMKTTTNDYTAKLFETFARGTLAIDTVKI
ncbi:hypothetical protein CFC21_096400 [Triticum aestivum]|uniref:Fe2OG dioxygenase domain-containing protein n=2 Tax=Triticum aestivum TaxID=4565 RepID=A0A3B6RA57_WHEAT|nr:hypothetical protein CFC21_096400 [Triticum aestivum]